MEDMYFWVIIGLAVLTFVGEKVFEAYKIVYLEPKQTVEVVKEVRVSDGGPIAFHELESCRLYYVWEVLREEPACRGRYVLAKEHVSAHITTIIVSEEHAAGLGPGDCISKGILGHFMVQKTGKPKS